MCYFGRTVLRISKDEDAIATTSGNQCRLGNVLSVCLTLLHTSRRLNNFLVLFVDKFAGIWQIATSNTITLLAFIHSLVHSFIYLLIHSCSHSFIHSFTHSLIHLLIQPVIHLVQADSCALCVCGVCGVCGMWHVALCAAYWQNSLIKMNPRGASGGQRGRVCLMFSHAKKHFHFPRFTWENKFGNCLENDAQIIIVIIIFIFRIIT